MCGRVKIKKGHVCIPTEVKDILYIEGGKANFVFIHLADGTVHKVWEITLTEWGQNKELVASGLFIRANKSYIINWTAVYSYDKTNGATLKCKTVIHLNEEGFNELEKRFFPDKENS